MHKRYFLVIFFLSIILLITGCGSTAGGGGGSVNLTGKVADLSINPVSNASVIVDTVGVKTVSNGLYTFLNIPAGNKLVKIFPMGFTSSYRKITLAGGSSATVPIAIVAPLDGKTTPIVNANGGTATSTTGLIKMVFGPAAFTTFETTVNVNLTAVPKIAAPFIPPDAQNFISFVVFAKPETATLSSSQELILPNITGITNEAVPFFRFNTSTFAWEQFGVGYADMATNTIRVHSPFMGWLAAIIPITPAPGSIKGTIFNGAAPLPGANVWTQTSFAVADSMGNYQLDFIPSGETQVFVSALGFSETSANVLVTSEQESVLNINMGLFQVAQGNISGTVKDASSHQGINVSGAKIVESNGGVAFSDDYGRYELFNVPSGTTIATAFADGYQASAESVLVPNGGTVTAPNFELFFVGTPSSYPFSFEAGDDGFTSTGFWHNQDTNSTFDASARSLWNLPSPPNRLTDYFSQSHGSGFANQKVFLPDNGQIPSIRPGGSGSHYFWYGQNSSASVEGAYIGTQDIADDTAEGSGGLGLKANSGTLESPELDLRGYTFGTLSFWTWWEIEGVNPATGFDKMQVLISPAPYSTWTSLGFLNPFQDPATGESVPSQEYSSGGFNQTGIWVNHSIDISQFAGQKVKIRFYFDSVDDLFNGFRGWFIDDVSISNSQFGTSNFSVLRQSIPYKPRKRRN